MSGGSGFPYDDYNGQSPDCERRAVAAVRPRRRSDQAISLVRKKALVAGPAGYQGKNRSQRRP